MEREQTACIRQANSWYSTDLPSLSTHRYFVQREKPTNDVLYMDKKVSNDQVFPLYPF